MTNVALFPRSPAPRVRHGSLLDGTRCLVDDDFFFPMLTSGISNPDLVRPLLSLLLLYCNLQQDSVSIGPISFPSADRANRQQEAGSCSCASGIRSPFRLTFRVPGCSTSNTHQQKRFVSPCSLLRCSQAMHFTPLPVAVRAMPVLWSLDASK
jgi:hypothetical protein